MKTGGLWVVVAFVACIALAGCGASGADAPQPTAVPATPSVTLAGIGEIVWAAAVDPATQAPLEPLVALPNDAPQVIAALPVETLPAGTMLKARWTIDGDSLPALDPDPITVEEGLTGAWVTWTMRWESDQPWPVGTLGIVIEIDGADDRRAEIPIVRPNA